MNVTQLHCATFNISLRVSEITKKFDGLILFQDYNFLIEDQEFVCFSGASGTGKTTLLNMIGGYYYFTVLLTLILFPLTPLGIG